MKTREEYDNIINALKSKLGDNFANVSDIIADLSNDYDTIIQADNDYKSKIDDLNNQRVQLLETNNKLFTQITNKNPETKEEVEDILNNKDDNEVDKPLSINEIVNEKGGLE